MAQERSIPYEILQKILSYISNDDKATLSSCSLISPCFYTAMQKRMYKSLELEYTAKHADHPGSHGISDIVWADHKNTSRSGKFLSALTSTPTLSNYIQELTITIGQVPEEGMMSLGERTTVTEVLAYLSSLTALSVISTFPLHYEHHNETLKASIRNLLVRNPNLAIVNLSGLSNFPSDELQHLGGVSSLSVSSICNTGSSVNVDNSMAPQRRERQMCRPISFRLTPSRQPWQIAGVVAALDGYSTVDHFGPRRSPPFLSFELLESLDLCSIRASPVRHVKELLSFVDPNRFQHLRIKTPSSALIEYSEGAPNTADLESIDLGLEALHSLQSFEIHGDIEFSHMIMDEGQIDQETTLRTMTDMLWISQVIETLSHPSMNSNDEDVLPRFQSLRVAFDVDIMEFALFHEDIMMLTPDILDKFVSVDFTPLVTSMRNVQIQCMGTNDVQCYLDLKVCDGRCKPDYEASNFPPPDPQIRNDVVKAFIRNPTLQKAYCSDRFMVSVVNHC
ncbi:hypothetical protein CVT24_001821 [Panaeolus cyanescens]|uniref:F-box domain-containing protein n=1 Tax=Panaeolus cyanescens TaxID=181874 RepID=A0A409YFI5_9AGAR|nr:hypothetical protein CVT24_001821 [Panaeolus cyanescens]